MVQVSGVSRIAAASVSGTRQQPPLIPRRPRAIAREERSSRTVLTVDLGYENLRVDELRLEAATRRYEREVEVLGSNGGRSFTPLTTARISRFAGSRSAPIALAARARYLRVEIENGDDQPLRGVKVSAASRSRALLVERGRPGPLTVLYGNPREGTPDYDYARLPVDVLELSGAAEGRLGEERMNSRYEPPPDTRSFSARYPGVVAAALALAALALGGVGLVALRSRPRTAN
jgi:hypothetical protein